MSKSSSPTLSKGFAIACEDLKIDERYLVYPGTERFPVRHGTQAIALTDLMQHLA